MGFVGKGGVLNVECEISFHGIDPEFHGESFCKPSAYDHSGTVTGLLFDREINIILGYRFFCSIKKRTCNHGFVLKADSENIFLRKRNMLKQDQQYKQEKIFF